MADHLHTNLRAAENVLRGGSMYGHLANEVKRARETLELILVLAQERDMPFLADLARDALHPRDHMDRPYPGELRAARVAVLPSAYVNAAGISASDMPATVVRKLDAAATARGGALSNAPSDEQLMELAREECENFRWPSTALSIMRKAIAAADVGGCETWQPTSPTTSKTAALSADTGATPSTAACCARAADTHAASTTETSPETATSKGATAPAGKNPSSAAGVMGTQGGKP